MSGPRPAGTMPLLLVSLLIVAATGPLQAAPTSPTEALLRAAQSGTTPTGTQAGSTPGATQPGAPDPGATQQATPTQPAPVPLPVIPPAPNQTPVRIGLGRLLTTTQTQAAEGLYILVDNRLVATTGPGARVTLTMVGTGQIQLGGQVEPVPTGGAQPQPSPVPSPMAPVSGTVRLVPKQASAPRANWVTFGTESYRGEGEVKYSPVKRKLTFVNTVNLEEYLRGVVPEEMPALWAIEAVKAQAVAARTYALCNMAGYPAEFFDLTDTTADQAYGGVKVEHPNSTGAVQATTGEVVRYNGQMITTFYSASTGGYTESMEIMFGGGPQPYLVGVPDFDNVPGNTNYAWSRSFGLADLKARLAAEKINVGEITAIAPEGAPGPGGHPPKWKVTGTKGEGLITGSRLRSALDLLAAPRAVKLLTASGAATNAGTGAPPTPAAASLAALLLADKPAATSTPPQTVKVLGADGRLVDRQVTGAVVQGADGRTTTLNGVATARAADGRQVAFQPPAPPPPPPPTPAPGPGPVASVQFDGGGNGHGIGMSQWGAYGMALQGKTYREILTHYYTGTKVEKP